jgi:hypothetical protein
LRSQRSPLAKCLRIEFHRLESFGGDASRSRDERRANQCRGLADGQHDEIKVTQRQFRGEHEKT